MGRKGEAPSPQGDFLVVMWRTLVGIRTGPFNLSFLPLAPVTRSPQTAHKNHRGSRASSNEPQCSKNKGNEIPFSRFLTFLEERVMRILCCGSSTPPSYPGLPDFIGGAYATSAAAIARGRREEWGGTRRGGWALGFHLEEDREEVAAESAKFWGARCVGVYVEARGEGENRVTVGCGWEEIWPLDRGLFVRSGCVSMTVGPHRESGPD